jgi:uncharacterized protein (DUF1499 family)
MKYLRRLACLAGFLAIAGAIVMFSLSWAARKPDHLGGSDGRLAACPGSPNCVSTQATDPKFCMEPIPLKDGGTEALAQIRSIMESMPRCTVQVVHDDYLHAEFSSRIFGFVDDVEFLVDEQNGQIHFRSASRVGYHDFGVNRRRMERICEAFAGRSERQ